MPVEEHKLINNTPKDDAILWRYMDFAKFVDLLANAKMWYARADSLGDEWEGHLPKQQYEREKSAQALYGMDEDHANIHANLHQVFHFTKYISCWHESNTESVAMWKLYLPGGDGVAVRTTMARVRQAFAGATERIHFCRVTYCDYDVETFKSTSFDTQYTHKRSMFDYEREVRGMTSIIPSDLPNAWLSCTKPTTPPGIAVPVDLTSLIDAIVISPFAPIFLESTVSTILRRLGLKIPIEQSKLSEAPPSLRHPLVRPMKPKGSEVD